MICNNGSCKCSSDHSCHVHLMHKGLPMCREPGGSWRMTTEESAVDCRACLSILARNKQRKNLKTIGSGRNCND